MAADIKTETVTYTAGGVSLVGYLAWDASQPGPRPGIVVFSEWWGVTEYLKRRARQLAELGYVALAADMYGGGKTAADATEAAELMNGLFADMDTTSAKVKHLIDACMIPPE